MHEVPDDGGFFQRVVLDKVDRMWPVDGPDIDYEPDASTSDRGGGAPARASPPMEVLLDQLTADDGNGMVYAPFFNYSYGDLSMTYEATLHPRTRMGLSDAGRALRRDLRRRHADVHAHPLGARPPPRTHDPARVRRAPADPADGRAVRPPRSRVGGPRACAPT